MATVTVHTPDGHTSFPVEAGALLADALAAMGCAVARPCGGAGRCGKCRVRAVGYLSPVSERERVHLSPEEQAAGWRLACHTRVLGEVCVWWEDTTAGQRIITAGHRPVTVAEPLFTRAGVAVDIGTTTLAARLYDVTGEIASAATPNSQSRYGADVISRIGCALEGKASELTACIRRDVNELLTRLCARVERSLTEVDALVITGNTAMLYLLTGQSVAPLAAAPFAITEHYGRFVTAGRLGLAVGEDTPVYLPPCMAAFVGADITTAQLASGLCNGQGTALLADIGTNGELTLWQNGRLTVCSTAAGPAFEAANISCGMSGATGAIDRVWVQDGDLRIHTIDNAPAIGICGSGVTDLVACLLQTGRLDETGYLAEGEVVLAQGVTFTQEDVRQVQLAKSAIRSGIETLLHTGGIACEQVERFAVAGGFGSYVSLDSAAAIGLIPPALRQRCHSIGNAALTGAAMLLCDRRLMDTAADMARQATHAELAMDAYFADQYIEQMML